MYKKKITGISPLDTTKTNKLWATCGPTQSATSGHCQCFSQA